MKNYTLNISHNKHRETILLKEGETVVLQAQPGTFYQLLDENGQIIEQPAMKWVGDDLQIYSDGVQEGMPDLILKDYGHHYPIQNSRYLHDMQSTLATAADEASLQQLSIPVAEEVGITTWGSAIPLWGAAAAAAVAGVAAASHGGGGSSSANEQQKGEVTQSVEEPRQETIKTESPAKEVQQKTNEVTQPIEDVRQETNNEVELPVEENQPKTDKAEQSTEEAQQEINKVEQSVEKTQQTEIEQVTEKTQQKTDKEEQSTEKAQQETNETEQSVEETQQTEEIKSPVAEPVHISTTVNTIAEDGVINRQESNGMVTFSGTVKIEGAITEKNISLIIGDKTYPAEVKDNVWSANIDGSALAGIQGEQNITVVVEATDASGQSHSKSTVHQYKVDTEIATPSITINPITADNVINAQESQGTVTVSGTVNNTQTGDTVTLTVGENTYQATVQNNGGFSANVDGSVLAAQGEVGVSVQTADGAGNQAQATVQHHYEVDTEIETPVVTLNPVAQDDIINLVESQSSVTVITGSAEHAQENAEVLLTVGEVVYRGAVHNGQFSVQVDTKTLVNHGQVSATLNTADDAGNHASASTNRVYRISTEYNPTISLNKIAGDNVLNINESKGKVTISGTVTDVEDGTDVVISCNCPSCRSVEWTDILAKVQNGAFSVDVAGDSLSKEGYNSVKVTVTAQDEAGNTATVSDSQQYSKDLQAPETTVSIHPIAGDDVFSKGEQAQATQSVSGTVEGLAADERIDEVVVSVNGQNHTTIVNGNSYTAQISSAVLAAAEQVSVTAKVSDAAGNSAEAASSRAYRVGSAEPEIILDPVAADNIISKAEADSNSFVLSGSVNNIDDGAVVQLSIGNSSKAQATISDGRFSVIVEKSFFGINDRTEEALGTLNAAVTHTYEGQAQTLRASQSYYIDLVNRTSISIDPVTGDNVLDERETAESNIVNITGMVRDGKEGAIVNVAVGGKTFSGTVQADGRYSVAVEPARFSPKVDEGKYTVSASVQRIDEAGNQGNGRVSVSRVLLVDKVAPKGQVVFDAVTGDNVINRAESEQKNILVSGRVNRLGEGDEVTSATVNIGGKDYAASVVGNTFHVQLPTEVLKANTKISARSELKDAVNRHGEATEGAQSYTLHIEEPTAQITIDRINGGKPINAADLSKTVTIEGSLIVSANTAESSTNVVVTVNGQNHTAIISGNQWVLMLPATDLAVQEGRLNVKAAVTVADQYGNTAEAFANQAYQVDTLAPVPVITLNNINTNNVIANAANGNINVSGKVSGEFKAGDKVNLSINNETYQATADRAGVFSISVPAQKLTGAAIPVIYAAISTVDEAGNSSSTHTSLDYRVTRGGMSIHLNPIAGDDVINPIEAKQAITVSGSVSGKEAKAGGMVDLTIHGETVQAQVQNDLSFSVDIAADKFLNNNGYTVSAHAYGANSAEAKTARSYEVAEASAAKIDITAIGDGFNVSTGQVAANIRLNGVIELDGAFADGMNSERLRQITVDIGEKTYKVGVKPDRSFFLDIPADEWASLEGKPLSFKVDADPQLYQRIAVSSQNGQPAYYIHRMERNEPVQIKEVKFDSPHIVTDAEGRQIVSGAVENQVSISGLVSGSAKAGDIVNLEIGDKVYSTEVKDDFSFSTSVSAAEMAAAKEHHVRAVLNAADKTGQTIAVSDIENYATMQANDSEFVNPHSRINSGIQTDHSADNYNFPYFIDKTGSLYGGSYGIPFGGKQDGPAIIKYHFMTLDEIAQLPENYNRYIDRGSMITYPSEMQDIVRNAYKQISAIANIEFVEVATAAEANTKFFMGNLESGFQGSSAIAYNSGLIAWNSRHNYLGWGKDFLNYVAMHEVTHTFNMKHTSIGFTGDYAKEETFEFSSMSYKAYANNNLFLNLGQLRTYDLAYMQYAFGPNRNVRLGNDVYTFKNYNMYSQDSDRYIWDAGGIDTFDASHEAQGVHVNLTPGSWIYVGDTREKLFSVKNIDTYDMHGYFGLDKSVSLSGYRGDKVSLNTYTEGQAFIGYGTQIENLIGSKHNDYLTGNKAGNNIDGGAGDDVIDGGAGDDYLDGGKGADILRGGIGNDIYMVDNVGDQVIELAGQGHDHVYSNIDYALTDHVEDLTLIGTTAIHGAGNAENNIMTGNGLDNILNGMAGDDRIIGGAGSDTLTGGDGRDTFVFDSVLDGSVDIITDFTVGQDKIELQSSFFDALSSNTMAEWEQYVQYHADTGHLTYDRDGRGSGDAIQFATLDKDLQIDQQSFIVV